jgi:small subunit ribosomal protein S1
VKTLEGDGGEESVGSYKQSEKDSSENAPSTFGDLLKAAAEGGNQSDGE